MQASLALRMCARTRSPIVGFFSRAPLSRVGLPHFRIPGNIAAWVTLLYAVGPALNWCAARNGQTVWRASLLGALKVRK